MSKGKDKDGSANQAILDYLNRQNRPYSATDVLNNLHKEHGKTAVVKALDSLAAEGKIKAKTYNKQTVYVANQTQFGDVDEAELKAMEVKTIAATNKLKDTLDVNRQLETELNALTSSLTTTEAQVALNKLDAQCIQMTNRLAGLKSNKNAVSPSERLAIIKSRKLYIGEWRKRKRMCMEMVNAVLEGYPKSKKEFLEEVGVETDEDVGAKIPDI